MCETLNLSIANETSILPSVRYCLLSQQCIKIIAAIINSVSCEVVKKVVKLDQ